MAKIAQITKTIEVIHSGNLGQYHQLSLEYGVTLFSMQWQLFADCSQLRDSVLTQLLIKKD